MFSEGSFGKKLDILKRYMDACVVRNQVIANNIANSDTQNFKRTDVTFEAQLKRALDSEKTESIPALLSDKKHIAFDQPVDYRDVRPKRVLDYLTTAKNNGNNVDIETETMNFMENQLMYQTVAQVIQSRFNSVQLVLR